MERNNFDIVRLLLAVSVVLGHAAILSRAPSLAVINACLSGRVAVEGFFAISGFLIFASYERSASLRQYCQNRAWRILPGYWLSTIFCVVLALCFGGRHFGRFLLANLAFASFLQPNVPGVFDRNPAFTAMNGALWTIKVEVMFYLSVPVMVWFCRRLHRRDTVLWALFGASVAYRMAFRSHENLALQLPGQLCFFVLGALVYYHLAWFQRHGRRLMLVCAGALVLHLCTGWFFARPPAIAGLTLGACLLLPHVQGPTRWGDFSYGTYVLHFPILQALVARGVFDRHPWAALALAVGLVGFAAALSWFFVEKPSLTHAKSRKLRTAALGKSANYPVAVP